MVAFSQGLPRQPLPTLVPVLPLSEEKTEQLVDTRHEVDQLVLELQKVKQEVSRGLGCVSWWDGTGYPATGPGGS